MGEIKVTFIVAAYNVEKYIEQCIDSVLEQVVEKEIIVVNDGSNDKTLTILETYARRYPCIRIISIKHLGLAYARNLGVRNAHGEYLCFIDGDSYYTEEFSSSFYGICKNNKLDMIRGWYVKVYSNGKIEDAKHSVTYIHKIIRPCDFFAQSVYQHAVERSAVIGYIRKDFFIKQNLWFEESLVKGDSLSFMKMFLSTNKSRMMQVNRKCFAIRMRTDHSDVFSEEDRFYDMLATIEQKIYFVEHRKLPLYYKKAANLYISDAICQAMSLYLRMSRKQQKNLTRKVPVAMKIRALRSSNNRRDAIKLILFTVHPKMLTWLVAKKEYGKVK